jgi:hypothetical protein
MSWAMHALAFGPLGSLNHEEQTHPELVFDSRHLAEKKEREVFQKRSKRDEKKPTAHAENAQSACLSF